MSATPDSTLAHPEQIIADLQRQLAECKAERDEALQRETATAEVLQVINSSPGNLARVFDAILEKAHNLCGVAIGSLQLYENGLYRAVATRGVPGPLADWLRDGYRPGPSNPIQQLAEGAPFVHIPDLAEIDDPPARRAVEFGGTRTLLWVALHKENTLLGMIVSARLEVRPFSEKEIALLQNFAAQAVIAMENARLLTETREALEQQTATAEVLGVINSSPGDLGPVFDAMLDKAMKLCDATFGLLLLAETDTARTVASKNVPAPFVDFLTREPMRLDPDTFLARALQSGTEIHVADATTGEPYKKRAPLAVAAVELGGIRTMLMIPMKKDGYPIGLFTIYRQEVRPFTDEQIALIKNFAAQAVIAMENARLITETREALEQQTATAEVLQVINSSPGDLAPVFDAMLEKATRLCEAPFGILRTWDGERFHLGAVHGDHPRYSDWARQRGPIQPDRDASPLGRILAGEKVVHFADVPGGEGYLTTSGFRDMVEASGVRSAIWVALHKDDALLGVIIVYRQEVRPFSDKQVALLQNFAAQAVIAMENARLLGELRQRTDDLTESLDYQTAIGDVLKVISQSTFDLEPVLETVLDTAMRLCGNDSGTIFRLSGKSYRLSVHRRLNPEEHRVETSYEHVAGDNSLVGRTALAGRPVHILDSWADPLYGLKDEAKRASWRTMLGVPLLREGVPLGVICMARKHVEPFTEKQIELVQTFADQAVIAIENARLLSQLRQRTEEVAELNRGLETRVAEQVEELGRVGRLKRFLAPQLAEMIVSQGDEKILESHRREIVVVFCDLRGYTAFTETAEPEEVLNFLREYHGALGPLVSQFEGTLDQFSGDGIMVFFNDPVPCSDPAERAVRMTLAMREAAAKLIAAWRRRGRELGFGAGIAQGYATLGQIGFAERSGYTAIGTVCNVAARLCAEAKDGQILLSQRVAVAVEGTTTLEEIGALTLKGLTQPVVAYNVPLVTSQPALRVIEGGPQSV